ncbi:hypothetical protein HQO42_11495 [Rhodococcus fascians]|nr:hypothetical protein [Rhodococcus fascians]MBY4237970.1 hypothetical protein [Rhodococcus fascians]MBY4253279.1 hypothetical protein [Rhodococcus fascians]MBY4268916.1 hypothetical protein [Rhodococcus fascians]
MSITVPELDSKLSGTQLPGDATTITGFESSIADHALLSPTADGRSAHPLWFLVIALRGMGISVDELCALADKQPEDTLLFGTCEIEQSVPLLVGSTYRTTARITETGRRTTRDESVLDSITVEVSLLDDLGVEAGSVVSVYLFKRGIRQ